MHKLAELLHELIEAAASQLTPNRRGELHALADDVAAALPAGPEKIAAEAVAGVIGTAGGAAASQP